MATRARRSSRRWEAERSKGPANLIDGFSTISIRSEQPREHFPHVVRDDPVPLGVGVDAVREVELRAGGDALEQEGDEQGKRSSGWGIRSIIAPA